MPSKNRLIGNSICDCFDEIVREYRFHLGEIETKVRIRILKQLKCMDRNEQVGPFYFETSHYVKTPLEAAAYITDRIYASTEDEALEGAINTLSGHYKIAVEKGLQPDQSWLILNQRY